VTEGSTTAAIVGPIIGSQPPWGAPTTDLDRYGYVVEEYHLEGSAAGHQLVGDPPAPVDGRWTVEEFARAPYRTRLLVVRPRDAARFNGTVVATWLNVSAGFEHGAPSSGEIFQGYAWVGVSAQEVGIYGFPAGLDRFASGRGQPLIEHDPERYGLLHHPGDPASFDIFTQAGSALAAGRDRTVDPLAGLSVERVVAAGGSQSAMRLVAYLNAFHPSALVFDGFLLSVWEGRAPRPEEGLMPMGVRTAIRTDTPTPVIVVNSEFETPHLAQIPCTDTDHLRIWEVAGTPHGVASGRRGDLPDRRGRVLNRLSYQPVHEAALRALHGWLADGTPALSQPRVDIDPGPPPRIRRDELGNACGGIRLPELEVPTHEYQGVAMGTGRPPLFGAARPFADEELLRLYPSRPEFTRRWDAAVDALVATAALRPEDAPAMKARGELVRLPIG